MIDQITREDPLLAVIMWIALKLPKYGFCMVYIEPRSLALNGD